MINNQDQKATQTKQQQNKKKKVWKNKVVVSYSDNQRENNNDVDEIVYMEITCFGAPLISSIWLLLLLLS